MSDEKQQLYIIVLIVFIGFVGSSMAYPIFAPLFLHPENSALIPSAWSESMRSICLGIALAAYPFGQFLGAPILGGCSDQYGRKRMLLLSLFGSTLGYLLTALALQFNWIGALLFSRFLTGLMESNLGIVRAMATDLRTINKYKSLGRISGAMNIGYVMGPLLSGFLSDHHLVSWFSFSFPFYIAMLLSSTALLFAKKTLPEKQPTPHAAILSIGQRFKLLARFKYLFQSNVHLKYLLIITTIFTFAVDIFFEFAPVYLTGLWSMRPAGIALYNAILSLTLGIGDIWLAYYLSVYIAVEKSIAISILLMAVILATMVLWPAPTLAFVLFGLIGLAIGIATTKLTTQISNTASHAIQGETMGVQLSLRMFGDAVICLTGGFLIISSVELPLACSCFIALIAMALYVKVFLTGMKLVKSSKKVTP